MSDFCGQCADQMGFGRSDMAGLTKPDRFLNGYAAVVLCEGCGCIQVDPDGDCLGDCRVYPDRGTHQCPHCRRAPFTVPRPRQDCAPLTFIMCPFHFEHVDG